MPVIMDAFSNAGRSRTQQGASDRGDIGDWHQLEPAKRNTKKFFLVLGLGLLLWVATYVGMLELIETNMGDLPLIHKAIIGFSVAMLMTMMPRQPMSSPVPANDTVAAFGPYAHFQAAHALAEPELKAEVADWPLEVARREAEVHFHAPANVLAMPVNRSQSSVPPGVGVELTRETIRYMMPASEAVLPAALVRLTKVPPDTPALSDGRTPAE